jgi:hypothetical protein
MPGTGVKSVEPVLDVYTPVAKITRPASSARARIWAAFLVGVLGIVLTAAFMYRVDHKPGVFYGDVKVRFEIPSSEQNKNPLATSAGGLAGVAGVIAKMVDPSESNTRVVSPTVTLVDQGIRNGYSVTLPNDGGQWANNFDQSLLDVQVVAPSAVSVSDQMQTLVNRIYADLTHMQQGSNVPPVDQITLIPTPSSTQIFYLTGSPLRAVGTTVVLGLTLTLAAMFFVATRFGDLTRLVRRRRRPRVKLGVTI